MDDLISRAAANDAYCMHECGMKYTECDDEYCGSIFADIPSAQPEQHFCRECKWCLVYADVSKYGDVQTYWYCQNWYGGTDEEGFCHEWERRES